MEATQMQNQSRAEGETRVEWVQDSARALWDAGTNICNKPPLSVSTYPELQGAKNGHRCMDVSVVSAAASRVASYKVKETSGTPWWSSSVLEKTLRIPGELPTEQPAVEWFPYCMGRDWTPLPGTSGQR